MILSPNIRNILFDLGGVHYAVNYHLTTDALQALAAKHGARSVSYTQAKQDPIFDEYEAGRMGTADFLDGVRRLMGVPASDAEITEAWNAMLLGLMPGRAELLDRVKNRGYRIALLSNTNALHWDVVYPQIGPLVPKFERVWASFEMGVRKPERESFLMAVDGLGWKPEETLFIDDSIQHVLGAKSAGLDAYHLTDAGHLERALLG